MCWSASLSERTGSVLISGVAMWSVDLQLDDVVLDANREGVDRDVGGQGHRLARAQIEERSVAGAFDGAGGGMKLPLGERTIVVRAAILDREQLAVAVEDADLEVLPFHDARGAGRELREGADVEDLGHGGKRRRAEGKIRCRRSELYRPRWPYPGAPRRALPSGCGDAQRALYDDRARAVRGGDREAHGEPAGGARGDRRGGQLEAHRPALGGQPHRRGLQREAPAGEGDGAGHAGARGGAARHPRHEAPCGDRARRRAERDGERRWRGRRSGGGARAGPGAGTGAAGAAGGETTAGGGGGGGGGGGAGGGGVGRPTASQSKRTDVDAPCSGSSSSADRPAG